MIKVHGKDILWLAVYYYIMYTFLRLLSQTSERLDELFGLWKIYQLFLSIHPSCLCSPLLSCSLLSLSLKWGEEEDVIYNHKMNTLFLQSIYTRA